MKKAFSITALILLLTGGISWYLKGCRAGPSHVAESARLDSMQHALDSMIGKNSRDSAHYHAEIVRWANKFDSLRQEDSAVRQDLLARAQIVKHTLTGGDLAAARHDTAAILINWDSLRAQVKAGLPIVIRHDSLDQEQIQACMAMGAVKDSVAEMWHSLFVLTDTAYRQSRTAYKGLLKDYNRQQFQLKLWKPVAIGGVAYVAASIIIHSLKK